MLTTGIHFDLSANLTAANNAPAFEHGESYPAIIAGLWAGQAEWQGAVSDGFAPLFIVQDENGKCVARAGRFIKCYAGYNLFNGKTAFAKLMQGMLGTTSEGTALQKEVLDAGISDIGALIGKPCSVRMVLKKSERGTYAIIDDVSRPTAKRPGLDKSDLTPVNVDVKKVFGKFVTIPDPSDAVYIEAVKLAVAVDRDAVDDNLF